MAGAKGYDVRDIRLAAAGRNRIEWAKKDMPVLRSIGARFAKETPLRGVRVAAPLMWLAVMSFHQDNPSLLNGGDDLLRIWTAYFAVFAALTPSRFLSVPLFGRRDEHGVRRWPLAPTWIVRVAQIQLTVISAMSRSSPRVTRSSGEPRFSHT